MKKNSNELKWYHIVTKKLWQIVLYLFEMVFVSFVFTCLTEYLQPIKSNMMFLERMIFSYGLYQIVITVTLNILNDIEKDSKNALLTILKLCELYSETHHKTLKNYILRVIDGQLDNATLNDIKYREEYRSLKQNLDELDVVLIREKIIKLEGLMVSDELNWRYSFLLRILK